MISDTDISLRIHGPSNAPTLVYLPGTHGDWTLIPSFRARVTPRARFVELSYPRTTTWTLEDYADAIETALLANGVTSGWLLAESWGSQPAWLLTSRKRFHIAGLVLAGGFARHPWPWAVGLTQRRGAALSLNRLRRLLRLYPLYARFRLRHAPETWAEMPTFLARRTEEDRHAAVHRLRLIRDNDLRPLARSFGGPVHYLTGAIDPVVPWPWVRRWLRRHCPGYQGTRVVWTADHNVLNSPVCAEQVLGWMGSKPAGT